MERIQFIVQMQDLEERRRLCRLLRGWMELYSISLEVVAEPPYDYQRPSIVFWDLDYDVLPPQLFPRKEHALFVCSADPQAAIRSYPFHPNGFLQKPIRMEQLEKALRRCAPLWWNYLDRVEILSDRVRMQVPFCNLIQIEGKRKGCLVHTFIQDIAVREPLYSLESRLPNQIFIRCQRSFVVNLCHVRMISRRSVHLCDGTEIPLGRSQKDIVEEAYRRFRVIWEGEAGV